MKKYLICVDSDGCAMDTMTIKHVRCFGPELVKIFQLEEWEQPVLTRWNEINLYTKSRGVNRFQGLLKILTEVDRQYIKIDGIETFADWVSHTDAYSETSLKKAAEASAGCELLEKALLWSQKVNLEINKIPEEAKTDFPGVKKAFATIKKSADLAIVSSANREAMEEEWIRCGLMQYADHAMAQDVGTKTACIQKMIKTGYDASKIIMIGDSVGDYCAATEAGVSFYPILAGKEEQSWLHFSEQVFDEIIHGNYTDARQKEEINRFLRNLRG